MISDVITTHGGKYFQTLDANGKKIAEKSEGEVGELLGFSSNCVLFRKANTYYVTYDENLKKIAESYAKHVGDFRNIAGSTMTFQKDRYIVTYDVNFKKNSERSA